MATTCQNKDNCKFLVPLMPEGVNNFGSSWQLTMPCSGATEEEKRLADLQTNFARVFDPPKVSFVSSPWPELTGAI